MTWEDIEGWFDFESCYREAVAHFGGGTLVEVGCFLGRSLCCLGSHAVKSGRPFRVVGVDTCLGSGVENGSDNHSKHLVGGTLAGTLHSNVVACGLSDTVDLIVSPSVRAASYFADWSLEFVFLDARHDYESVADDIRAWLPKVKAGGWIGGDDYCDVWPGVKKAVSVMLPGHHPWGHDSWRFIVK